MWKLGDRGAREQLEGALVGCGEGPSLQDSKVFSDISTSHIYYFPTPKKTIWQLRNTGVNEGLLDGTLVGWGEGPSMQEFSILRHFHLSYLLFLYPQKVMEVGGHRSEIGDH